MTIRENIIELRKQSGMSQKEFGKIAGVTRAAVSQWEGGFSEPRMGAIQAIADHFGVLKSNIIEDNGMDGVDVSRSIARPRIPGSITPAPARRASLPLLGRVHAGDAQEPEVVDERMSLPAEVAERHPRGYFLVVEGDCMSNVYPEGCVILIDPDVAPTSGSIAVVSIDGADYVTRRLYVGADTMVLSPDSASGRYSDIVVREGDGHDVSLCGTVVWFQASKEME